ncbi:dihydrolipoamide acetyltransferase family protein [Subtercola frigoramans]|uniref:Dihydrolipoamide acetyltransferase component of pyruvate dehydrogenase complex n=1 Tax=Subtercola frigoramans TaxID=120298 RepID=A0ABS2L0R9_9MICO|nr:dihydrolipoamide acetyltransferase family protein [Subtercola frigoramans]MBM7470683.1 pyruvate dehydrogenase E2 component (dihydrolipoamide acetyltransferase) [Subtercola frigoramans]
MSTIIRMPEVLANTSEASIQTWLVKLGDQIAVGSPLAEVETEKAVVEYAAETGGTVLELLVAEGDSIAVGEPIAVVGEVGEQPATAAPIISSPAAAAPSSTAAEPPEPETAPEVETPALEGLPTVLPPSAPDARATADSAEVADDAAVRPGAAGGRLFVSPIVRRLARERGLDLSQVRGSGPGGRIVRRDIDGLATTQVAAVAGAVTEPSAEQAAVAVALPVAVAAPAAPAAVVAAPAAPATAVATPAPAAPVVAAPAPAAPAGAYEEIPHTGMRRAIARRLTESKSTVPHFYLVADCTVDALLELRARVNEASPVKISVNDFVLKAAAAAFTDVPEANATWGENAIRRYSTVDMSVAVSIDGGLVTPVLRSVEKMALSEVSRTVVELAERARAGRLKQHELEGGSFAVSNLGMYGVTEFSAIINPPQSAILAVGRARPLPVVVDGELAVATVMTVTMSADHRVLDGALAAQWLAAFVRRIENPLSILI